MLTPRQRELAAYAAVLLVILGHVILAVAISLARTPREVPLREDHPGLTERS